MAEPTDSADGASSGSNVVPLPLTRARATDIVRQIAKTARWSVIVPYTPAQPWRQLVNRRQVALCLLEGYVLEEHTSLDEHGNWRFHIGRVCAGLNVVIEVALENTPALPRLFVIGIEGDQI